MRALFAALMLAAVPSAAQVRTLAPSAAPTASASAAVGPTLAAALLPELATALLGPASPSPSAPVPVPAAVPVSAAPATAEADPLDTLLARGWVRSGAWMLVLREGVNDHGRRVLAIDALEADAPANAEAIGHIDLKIQDPGLPAVLDGSLDWYLRSDRDRLPPGAEPARWRSRLGLGIAVESAWQGRGLGALLLDLGAALAAREGATKLVIYATESSRGFYRARFGGRVIHEESFIGADESKYHRLTVSL